MNLGLWREGGGLLLSLGTQGAGAEPGKRRRGLREPEADDDQGTLSALSTALRCYPTASSMTDS